MSSSISYLFVAVVLGTEHSPHDGRASSALSKPSPQVLCCPPPFIPGRATMWLGEQKALTDGRESHLKLAEPRA